MFIKNTYQQQERDGTLIRRNKLKTLIVNLRLRLQRQQTNNNNINGKKVLNKIMNEF